MKTLHNILIITAFGLILTACGGGGGDGEGDGSDTGTGSSNTGSNSGNNSGNNTGGNTGGNGVTAGNGFTLTCDPGNGIVGCWVTPCIETDSTNHIYAQQMVSFRADGSVTHSTASHLGSSSCQSTNAIEVENLYDRTYTQGSQVLTGSGTLATELNSTQAIPNSQTLTQHFSLYQIVSDQLCFPDADYSWEPGNHPGFTYGPTLPSHRGTDIDFANCLTRYVP